MLGYHLIVILFLSITRLILDHLSWSEVAELELIIHDISILSFSFRLFISPYLSSIRATRDHGPWTNVRAITFITLPFPLFNSILLPKQEVSHVFARLLVSRWSDVSMISHRVRENASCYKLGLPEGRIRLRISQALSLGQRVERAREVRRDISCKAIPATNPSQGGSEETTMGSQSCHN